MSAYTLDFLLPLGSERDTTVRPSLGSTNDPNGGKGSLNDGRPNSLNRLASSVPRPAWAPYQMQVTQASGTTQ